MLLKIKAFMYAFDAEDLDDEEILNQEHNYLQLVLPVFLIAAGCSFFYFLSSGHKYIQLEPQLSKTANVTQPKEIEERVYTDMPVNVQDQFVHNELTVLPATLDKHTSLSEQNPALEQNDIDTTKQQPLSAVTVQSNDDIQMAEEATRQTRTDADFLSATSISVRPVDKTSQPNVVDEATAVLAVDYDDGDLMADKDQQDKDISDNLVPSRIDLTKITVASNPITGPAALDLDNLELILAEGIERVAIRDAGLAVPKGVEIDQPLPQPNIADGDQDEKQISSDENRNTGDVVSQTAFKPTHSITSNDKTAVPDSHNPEHLPAGLDQRSLELITDILSQDL